MPVQGAARKGDQVTHTQAMNGMLLGVGLGVLAVAGAALVVGTGGIGLPFVLGAAAVIGGSGLFGEAMGATEPPSPCGPILEGVPTVIIGPDKKQAAMATAHVHCDQHSSGTVDATLVQAAEAVAAPAYALYSALTSGSGPQIAEGSSTVFLSSQRLMAARMGDKGTCGFVIGEGLPTVIIGGPAATAAGLSVDGEVPEAVNVGLTALMFAPAAVEVLTAGSVGLGLLALGRVGVGVLGAAVGSEVLGDIGAHFGPKGRVIGQFVGGFLGGYGASKGAGKALKTGPGKAAAGRAVDFVDRTVEGWFGGGRAGGGVASVPEGAGAAGAGAPPPAAAPAEPLLPGGRTQADVDRINAGFEATKRGWRNGDDLPGRDVQSLAQSLMEAIFGRGPRPALAGAGAGDGGRGGRGLFDEGGGVFSPKKGATVLEARATGTGGSGTGTGGSGTGGGNPSKSISRALYDSLRKRTPSKAIRKVVNKNTPTLPYDDPALPKLKVTGKLEADHIVPMKTITEMNGFDKLSKADQVKVLNYENNFIGLSKTANTSKGAQSYSEWTEYKKMDMKVDPSFRQRMMQKENDMTIELQKYIDGLPKI